MNFYNPLTGEVDTSPVTYRPETCFLLVQIGGTRSPELLRMREQVESLLGAESVSCLDASSVTTGRDFLLKIWKLIYSVPLIIALVDRYTPVETMQNIYYELGIAQAMGKETLIILGEDANIPSDLMRTEYIRFDEQFEKNFKQFIKEYAAAADFYETISEQLERNPVLAIDYLRRSYLISGDSEVRAKVTAISEEENLADRAKTSVEVLLASF